MEGGGGILASSVPEVGHLEVKVDGVVDGAEDLFAVCRS